MAKNKNQNRQRGHEQDRQRESSSGESQDQAKSSIPEEHVMPAATTVPRKQQKKFGHN
ncbi:MULTISPECIES: hypothetical protein [unclassified Streptomyces]|uniref:hypothetical protein n=1 Tax=unclassified Streptomyces TaxID=2593676 RepID=UPI002E2BF1E9|nr:hypothetical protein [Streptomyces sp. NBC_00223]